MAASFPHLFSPIKIGRVTLRNRLVFLAHTTFFGDLEFNGKILERWPSKRDAFYYAERAKGGVGLVIGPSSHAVHISGQGWHYPPGYTEEALPGLKLITRMVHDHGAAILSQIYSPGSSIPSLHSRHPTFSPSGIPDPLVGEIPKVMEKEDIREVIEGFARSAEIAKKGGFDGVELKAGHDGLIREFWSPSTNTRTDEYGGSFENRMRFSLEVLEAIRNEVGEGFVLGVRPNIDEMKDGGYGIEEGKRIAKALSDSGLVDYLNTDLGNLARMGYTDAMMAFPQGYAVHAAAAIKPLVKVPVVTFGRINDPHYAEKLLADGTADLIGMARPLMSDPELPNKAREGRVEEIRPCIACNFCVDTLFSASYSGCIHNPAAGREELLGIGSIRPAERQKKIVVVGGGPAGLRAAEIAASRGHSVTLFEKGRELGGQVRVAARAPTRADMLGTVTHLTVMLRKLGVDVKLSVTANEERILAEKPDAVVIATGSSPVGPPVKGADLPNVLSAVEVLSGEKIPSGRVIVLDNVAHQEGTSVAELCAEKGCEVEIVTPNMILGVNAGGSNFVENYIRISGRIKISTCTGVREIRPREVVVYDVFSGADRVIQNVDYVVHAWSYRPNDQLYFALKGRVKELYRVGDCLTPRRLDSAIWEGEMVGRKL